MFHSRGDGSDEPPQYGWVFPNGCIFFVGIKTLNCANRGIIGNLYINDVPKKTSNWWFVFDGKQRPDVGYLDPSLDVDLYIETSLSSLTKVWLGESTPLIERETGFFALLVNMLITFTSCLQGNAKDNSCAHM